MLIIDPDSSPDTSPRPSPLSEPAYLPPIPSALDMARHKDRKDSDDGFEMLDARAVMVLEESQASESIQHPKDQACNTNVKDEQTTDQNNDQFSQLGKAIFDHRITNKNDEKVQETEDLITISTLTPTGSVKGFEVNNESMDVTIRTLDLDQSQSQPAQNKDDKYGLEPRQTTDDAYLPPVSFDGSKSTAAPQRPKTDDTVNKLLDSEAVYPKDNQEPEVHEQHNLPKTIGETNKDDQNPEAPRGFKTPHQVPASEVSEAVIERNDQIKSHDLVKPFQSDNQGSPILISAIETSLPPTPFIKSPDEPTGLLIPTPTTATSTTSLNSFEFLSGTPTPTFQHLIASTKCITLSEADGVILGLIPQSRQAEYSTGHQIGKVGLSTSIATTFPLPSHSHSEYTDTHLLFHTPAFASPLNASWGDEPFISANDSEIDFGVIGGARISSTLSHKTEKAVTLPPPGLSTTAEIAPDKTGDQGEAKVGEGEELKSVWLARRMKQYERRAPQTTTETHPTEMVRSGTSIPNHGQANITSPAGPKAAVTSGPKIRSQKDIDKMSTSQRKKYKRALAAAQKENQAATTGDPGTSLPDGGQGVDAQSDTSATADTAKDHQPDNTKNDLAAQMKDTFRLIYLYREQGTSGLNEKILIDQKDVVRLANTYQPKSALDMDLIDFTSLDDSIVHIRGVYGDREQLIKYLVDLKAVDEPLSKILLKSDDIDPTVPFMRCGLYLVKLPSNQAVIFFWPEQMTWDRAATKNVITNRVTFMRYLSQVSDQLYCLIGEEQLKDLDFEIPDIGQDDSEWRDDEMDAVADLSVQRVSESKEGISLDEERSRTIQINLPKQSSNPLPANVLADLRPRLVTGLKSLGVMTAEFCEGKKEMLSYKEEPKSYYALQSLILTAKTTIATDMPLAEVDLLLRSGLLKFLKDFPQAQWAKLKAESDARVREAQGATDQRLKPAADAQLSIHKTAAEIVAADSLSERFPAFAVDLALRSDVADRKRMSKLSNDDIDIERRAIQTLDDFFDPDARLRNSLLGTHYQRGKTCIIEALDILKRAPEMSASERHDLSIQLLNHINDDGDGLEGSTAVPGKIRSAWRSIKIAFGIDSNGHSPVKVSTEYPDDVSFIRILSELEVTQPCLGPAAKALMTIARKSLLYRRDEMIREGTIILRIQQLEVVKDRAATETMELQLLEDGKIAKEIIAWLNEALKSSQGRYTFDAVVLLQGFQELPATYCSTTYSVTYEETTVCPPSVEYNIQPLGVSSTQLNLMVDEIIEAPHNPQLDLLCANSLKVYLKPHLSIRSFLYLDDRQSTYIMIVDDPKSTKTLIYLSTDFEQSAGSFDEAEYGHDFLVTVDLRRREFAVVSSQTLMIYKYKISSDGHSCIPQPSMDLKSWCAAGARFVRATFLADKDKQELVLVDSTGQAKIFNMASSQFRPPSVGLANFDSAHLLSTTDGTAFLSSFKDGEDIRLRGHIASSLGEQEALNGHTLDLILSPTSDVAIFAPASPNRMVLVYLDTEAQTIRSTRLVISNEDAQDQLLPDLRSHTKTKSAGSSLSPLLGVFDDMWTRFPVVAAIERDNLDASTRVKPALTLIEPTSGAIRLLEFQAHWDMVVVNFKKRTNKPTNGTIENTVLGVSTLIVLGDQVSAFKLGQLLVELCCLIPLHLAVARDQSFIPFTRGVDDIEWSRRMLGEGVEAIASTISLGWYEAILGQYYRHKPVRVISSLGNQSVGKSYMLNHIAGSSFAGAAGRTTEGVWMAVAPTRDCVYVLLDFEGVNSPERSLQEDMFLVLFNAALSNMVLFRNHLNLSRDLMKLLEAYKSSAAYFDPDANPGLFNGKLVMIIKDVLSNDAAEATIEFKQKFQEVVMADGNKNFLSRLHRKKMKIVPWPVIQDPRFYSHFDKHIVKDLQEIEPTWKTAGQFIDTLKLLEAKLKATDWTPLDSNLVSQRIKLLQYVLSVAISHGTSDEKQKEPLAEISSAKRIPMEGDHIFDSIIFNDRSPMTSFDKMYEQYSCLHPRSTSDNEWKTRFLAEVSTALQRRIALVSEWSSTNIQSLPQDHSDVIQWTEAVKNGLDKLQQGYRTCSQTCANCDLACLHLIAHDGDHDCRTSHKCDQKCGYEDDHQISSPPCNLRAMHQSRHVCDPKQHTCAEPCASNSSCKSTCTRTRDHPVEQGHMCSARFHICDHQCDFDDGKGHNCGGRCTLKLDEPHTRHECLDRSCSMSCALCPRMCSQNDHFHGMKAGAVHLCGQDHACARNCEHKGICEIAPQPSAVQTVFKGALSTFKYTKYSQLAKRLKCVKRIPAGKLHHQGDHSHQSRGKPFHHCDQKCPSCEYYCKLPIGHPQLEHETSHGNMTATRWAMEDGEQMHVGAHHFAQGDNGAPMMCDKVCASQGRHTHIVQCRSDGSPCLKDEDHEHMNKKVPPNPDRPKDSITHKLFWQQIGWKDPYTREQKDEFKLCDHLCRGKEHATSGKPSHCILPLFHPPATQRTAPMGGFVCDNGHVYNCPNPMEELRPTHFIFVLDRSNTMKSKDRTPVQDGKSYAAIAQRENNRYGAALSTCYKFWTARQARVNAFGPTATRADTYSIIVFNENPVVIVGNDQHLTPDALLAKCLQYPSGGAARYGAALVEAQAVMLKHWNDGLSPVVMFLSDGQSRIRDHEIHPICRMASAKGIPLNLHAISVGPEGSSASLKRMADISSEVQRAARPDPGANSEAASSFSSGLEDISLPMVCYATQESLYKPRGSLVNF